MPPFELRPHYILFKTKRESRYNTFYVLYPLGIASETYLIYRAIAPASDFRIEYTWILKAILLAYVPGELSSVSLSCPLPCLRSPAMFRAYDSCLHLVEATISKEIVTEKNLSPLSRAAR